MPDWNVLARWTVLAGLALVLFGGLIWIVGRTGLPLGRLPGDIRIQTEQISCFVPLASMLLISLVLTVVVNLVLRWLGK
jgi:hypothetical protein